MCALIDSLCDLTDGVACFALADALEEQGKGNSDWYRGLGRAVLTHPGLGDALRPVTTSGLLDEAAKRFNKRLVNRCIAGARLSSTWCADGAMLWRKDKRDLRAISRRIPEGTSPHNLDGLPHEKIGERLTPQGAFQTKQDGWIIGLAENRKRGIAARYVAFVAQRWPTAVWHTCAESYFQYRYAVCAVVDGQVVALSMTAIVD